MSATVIAIAVAWAVFAAGMGLAWRVEQKTGNSGWIDVVWTLSLSVAAVFGIAAAVTFGTPIEMERLGLALLLLGAWAGRLAGHLVARSARVADDPRYARLRQEWGEEAPKRLAILLQFQALLSLPLLLTVVMAATVPEPATLVGMGPGTAVCALGLFIGWRADRDLTAFKTVNTGLCTVGLWRYSRHPNYFGEFVFWVGFALLSWDHGTAGLVAITGPVTIYVLLRYVSGVPPLEAHMASRYGPAFDAYRSTTPPLVPWPRRRESGTLAHRDRDLSDPP